MKDLSEVTLITTGGEKIVARRCGAIPDLFATRDGDVILIQTLRRTEINKHCNVRYRGRMLASRYLVADAWKPGWENKYQGLGLTASRPLDTALENLAFSKDARRGKPRSDQLQTRAGMARIAIQCGDLNLASDETGWSPNELFEAILEWWPEELIEMEGLPEKFVTSKAYRDLEATRDMRKLAKQRRAEKEAKRVNDITEDSTSDNYDFGEVPETPPQPNFADEEVE